MNKKRLIRLGVPEDGVPVVIAALHRESQKKSDALRRPKQLIPKILDAPELYLTDESYADFAQFLVEWRHADQESEPIEYRQWGQDIDENSRAQMTDACRLPMAVAAALMPDAHVGYGLPIGGVLALENAVVPYAVGVDIACRMKLTITDLPVETVAQNDASQCRNLDQALEQGTLFGAGKEWRQPYHHPVLDEDWSITAITRQVKDRARKQMGTSGSGNHFVEWGVLTLPQSQLGVAAGQYVALLSHSGSRGAGAKVCQRYSEIARRNCPRDFAMINSCGI